MTTKTDQNKRADLLLLKILGVIIDYENGDKLDRRKFNRLWNTYKKLRPDSPG